VTAPPDEQLATCACGRPLRDPVSIARGLGPVCWRKLHGPTARWPRTASPAPEPGEGQTELPLAPMQPTLWSL